MGTESRLGHFIHTIGEFMAPSHRMIKYPSQLLGSRRHLYMVGDADNRERAVLGVAAVLLGVIILTSRDREQLYSVRQAPKPGPIPTPTLSDPRESLLRLLIRENGINNAYVRSDQETAVEIVEPLGVYLRDLPSQEKGSIVGSVLKGQSVEINPQEVVELAENHRGANKYWRVLRFPDLHSDSGGFVFMATADSKEERQCFVTPSNPNVPVC